MSEKIKIVRIKFHHMPDYILTEQEYKERGGWSGLLKHDFHMKDVKKVYHELMDAKDFPTTAWEG